MPRSAQVLAVADRLVALDTEKLRSLATLLQSIGREELKRGQTLQGIANNSLLRALAREVAEMLLPTITKSSSAQSETDRDHDHDDETETP